MSSLFIFKVYMEEFGGVQPNQRPIMMALVITDGEADDSNEFARALSQVPDKVYVTLAIIG